MCGSDDDGDGVPDTRWDVVVLMRGNSACTGHRGVVFVIVYMCVRRY